MSTLQQFIDTVTASSEADVTELLKVMNPTTEEEMGPVYQQVIGYNPITYFDEKIVNEQIDKVLPYAPNKAGQILVNKRSEIVELAMKNYKMTKPTFLQSCLELAIRDFVSVDIWDDEEMEEAFDDVTDTPAYDEDEEDESSEFLDEEEEDDIPFGFEEEEE